MRLSHLEPTKVLGRLNVAAVALSLAGVTAAVIAMVLPGLVALVAGVSTLVFGALWGLVLRQRWSDGTGDGSRWGLLACVPLALLNAATIVGVLHAWDSPPGTSPVARFFEGMKMGVWDGGLVWIVALVLTHVTFGAPIIRSHTLAREQGVAGVDRGERSVGRVCVLVAIIALTLPSLAPEPFLDDPPDEAFLLPGMVFMRGAAVLGAILGGLAASLSFVRS